MILFIHVGALSKVRAGVRVISDNPALAIIFKTLLIPTPPRLINHFSRYDGWNLGIII